MNRLIALLPVLIAFQVGAPPALAWTWPVDGPVLRPFTFGEDPYAAGQHRGIDVADEPGAPVRAPSSGIVSFAGSVPGGGRTVTVETADGYSVTLVHLGTIAVVRHEALAEGTPVGTIGPTGDAEHDAPYVHLGIRLTSDAQGYVDPLGILPGGHAVPPAPPAPPADQVPVVPPAGSPDAPAPQVPVPAPHVPAPAHQAPAPQAPAPAPHVPAPVPEASGSVGHTPSHGDHGHRASAAAPASSPVRAGSSRMAAASAVPARRGGVDEISLADAMPSRSTARVSAVSFELPPPPSAGARSSHPGPKGASEGGLAWGSHLAPGLVAVAVATALSLVAGLAVRRRQLVHAVTADGLAPVLENGARRPAEDAGAPGPGQQDRLVFDRDLESVSLGEAKPLPDLDRDDDAAELVEMANDPCRRLSAAGAPTTRIHRVRARPPSRCRRAETISAR